MYLPTCWPQTAGSSPHSGLDSTALHCSHNPLGHHPAHGEWRYTPGRLDRLQQEDDERRKAFVKIERPSYTGNVTSLLKTSDMWLRWRISRKLSFQCFYTQTYVNKTNWICQLTRTTSCSGSLSHMCHHHHVWWDCKAACHFRPFRPFLKFEVWFSGLDGQTGRCGYDILSPFRDVRVNAWVSLEGSWCVNKSALCNDDAHSSSCVLSVAVCCWSIK